jgi:PAS domain S-box-containing protein
MENTKRSIAPQVSKWLGYGLAIVLTTSALALTLQIPDVHRDPFYTLFTIAVAISAWIGGRRAGILALLISIASAVYLFMLRFHYWSAKHDVAQLVFFAGTAFLVMWLIAALQSTYQHLRESEARFRTLTEAVPQMLWSADASGGVDFLSQQWLSYTGQPIERGLGGGWQEVLHPEERDRVIAEWLHSVESGEAYEVQARLRRADGAFRWMLIRGIPLRDSGGKITKWFGACTDIHEQKIAEEALRKAEKLGAAGRLASTMAHEINNPLEAVTNLLFLAMSDPALPEGACRDYLTRADQELVRVTHMVRQALGWFHGSVSRTFVNVGQAIDSLLIIYSGKITSKNLRLDRQVESKVELKFAQEELRHVLANLLSNAIDASPSGGTIRLHAYERRDWAQENRRGVFISVADSGPGIRPEDRSNLFEPFFTTKKDVGSGLGLWAAKLIVERWKGRIRFRSSTRAGQSGTVFSVFLPITEEPQPAPIGGVGDSVSQVYRLGRS